VLDPVKQVAAVDQLDAELRGLGKRLFGEIRERHDYFGATGKSVSHQRARELADLVDADPSRVPPFALNEHHALAAADPQIDIAVRGSRTSGRFHVPAFAAEDLAEPLEFRSGSLRRSVVHSSKCQRCDAWTHWNNQAIVIAQPSMTPVTL
jgi:hypothetical protein